jgi:dihydroorotate dehydrogenase
MYKALRPLLFTLPPEAAHGAAMVCLRAARPALPLFAPWLRYAGPGLAVELAGLRFPNPLGLAAGFDKSAAAVDAWQHLGFGHVELGTITRHGQPGNERPRAFRYPAARALINRFGFNNPGADAVARRLESYRRLGRWPAHPVGINIGKSKVTPVEAAEDDYLYSLGRLLLYADYFAVNVSSPNTPGLRSLQGPRSIRSLSRALKRELKRGPGGKIPLFVKFAPDLEPKDLLASCDAALGGGADGLILTNTTLSRQGLQGGAFPDGGLSGAPLTAKADACLAAVARHTRGRVPIIGVGGVFSAEDARRKLDLGARLVQVYTGFIYEGPGLARRVCKSLADSAVGR